MLSTDYGNSERASNHMPWPLYFYLSSSALLVSFTDSNKQFPNVKSVFEFLGYGPTV